MEAVEKEEKELLPEPANLSDAKAEPKKEHEPAVEITDGKDDEDK